MKKVKFQTLGCKVNQYETQGMREKLSKAGFVETQNDTDADLFVLNTCTVTGEADKKNQYLIRRMHRKNPNTKIIVTGCYAERNVDEIVKLEGVSEVLRQNEKDLITEKALLQFDIDDSDFSLCRGQEEDASHGRNRLTDFSISEFDGHARAFIKVQDGCTHACSFCKVVLVRGKSRSRTINDVVDEVKRVVDAGFKETVLTGIQLGAYGQDLDNKKWLSDLVSELLKVNGLDRLRLSSIEPTDVSSDLIQIMSETNRLCPHLHIPLQSGDEEVLKRMKRRYPPQFYKDLVLSIQEKIDFFALTCDVMTGFPGETEQQFQNTINLLAELKPLKIHAFPYSSREGTVASRYEDHLPSEEIHSRNRRLIKEGKLWQSQFLSSYLGKRFPVLVEEEVFGDDGKRCLRGRTSNYILTEFDGSKDKVGNIIWVELEKNNGDRIWAKESI